MATDNLLDVLHQRFREAFKSGQQQALRAVFASGATVVPPNRAPLVGHDAILSFWERARRIQDVVFEPTGSQQLGDDVLRETGTLRLMLQGQGQGLRARETTYLSIWRRIDGDWRLDSMMWRPDNAQGRPRVRGGARQQNAQGDGDGAPRRARRGGGNQGGNPAGNRGGNQRGNRGDGPEDGSRGSNIRGFGPRARRSRADNQAPMIPKVD